MSGGDGGVVGEVGTSANAEKIRKLEAQVFQLKNVIRKLTGQLSGEGPDQEGPKSATGRGQGRPFDFAASKRRHVLLHLVYFGWDYHGFAVQETTGRTIESELFRALIRTRLIQSREASNYHRCGRTDRGVSAFNQVVSIDLRTNLLRGPGVFSFEGCTADDGKNEGSLELTAAEGRPDESVAVAEIDYCKIINANLPDHIQVVAWAPCEDRNYSARFNCVRRAYKYFFPKGGMDLDKMNRAGAMLEGEHDFRNFCKMDVAHGVVAYVRRLKRVRARPLQTMPLDLGDDDRGASQDLDPRYDMCVLTVEGNAFLWHQVRCIVSVLFLVGAGLEEPEVVLQLLDVENNPRRPQYKMASEVPLNLFEVEYDADVVWHRDLEATAVVVRRFQALWTDHCVKATMLRAALFQLEAGQVGGCPPPDRVPGSCSSSSPTNCLIESNLKAKRYVPLMQLQKCTTLEEKLNSSSAKRRKNL